MQFWQCTANVRDSAGKTKRCPIRVKTRVVSGYEMIQDPNVVHDHPRALSKYDKAPKQKT